MEGERQFFEGLQQFYNVSDVQSLERIKKALALIPHEFICARGVIETHLALSMHKLCGSSIAVRSLRKAIRQPAAPAVTCNRRIGLSLVHVIDLELSEAHLAANQLCASARELDGTRHEAWGTYVAACTHFLRNELAEAIRSTNENAHRPFALYARMALDCLAIRVMCLQSLGDTRQAEDALAAMDEFAHNLQHPAFVTVTRSCEARLALMQGDTERARQVLPEADTSRDRQAMFQWAEIPQLTQCRVWLASDASSDVEKALHLLDACAAENRAVHNRRQLLEVLVLQASAHLQLGDEPVALTALRKSLSLARRGNVLRPFVDAGPRIIDLLRRLGREADRPAFVRAVLAACGGTEPQDDAAPLQGGGLPEMRALSADVLAMLTEREAEVLGLVMQRLQTGEIADQLFVAPSTVNSHLKSIYKKLDVRSRREAIAKIQASHRGRHVANA